MGAEMLFWRLIRIGVGTSMCGNFDRYVGDEQLCMMEIGCLTDDGLKL